MTNKVKSFLVAGCASVALMFNPASAVAQQPANMQQMPTAKDYSDEELKNFADATMEVQKLQMEMQQQMAKAVQEEGMDPAQFQKMAQAQQTGKETEEVYTEEEQQAFANAMKAVMAMQQEVQTKMQSKLEDNGMTMEEYQTMAMSIQQSPEMTKKVQEMMQGS